MDWLTLARAAHVLAVVHWIGGVAMVTLVLLPSLRALPAPERLAMFERIEGRFGAQAKLSTQVAGLTGLWMTWDLWGWDRFLDPGYWWMHAMVLVWALFTFVLFIAEPRFLHRWFHARATVDPDGTFALILRFHRVLLALSNLTIAGAVLGAHGAI